MEGGESRRKTKTTTTTSSSSPPLQSKSNPKPKFSVYQNPNFSAALTAASRRPTSSAVLLLSSLACASAFAVLAAFTRKHGIYRLLGLLKLSYNTAGLVARVVEAFVGLAFVVTLTALARVLWGSRNSAFGVSKVPPSKKSHEKVPPLTERQLGLLGLKVKPAEGEAAKKPPKSTPVRSLLEPLVPIRKHIHSYSPSRASKTVVDQQGFSGGKNIVLSPISPSPTRIISPSRTSKNSSGGRGILTEEMLEQFLADVDEKIVESAVKAATPPPTLRGFAIASPGSLGTSAATSGTTRSTPLRPVRMSPGSRQKYGTPPKKGEGELPPPMTMEQTIDAFNSLGIYPQIEQWRDSLRQWFSSFLLNPLVEKVETSHVQVMQTAAAIGFSIVVDQVGTDSLTTPAPVNVSPIDGSKEWQPTFTLDEDGLLNQLSSNLVRARDGSVGQQSAYIPVIQACIDAVTEHQRLNSLMKGELVKGLLPQSSVQADYAVKRVRELSEGTCVKNFDYMESGELCDKPSKKWTNELPSDSHLLAYLFCAFLDHPKWMLHVDPTSYSSTQSSKNPLFLGFLPPKDRFPEKYVAVISSVPSVIHPGACILVIGKQNPPTFTLYWEKKLQFSLQGRTALWDSILLLCYRINSAFGGVVRGLHLGSPAFNILPIFKSEDDE